MIAKVARSARIPIIFFLWVFVAMGSVSADELQSDTLISRDGTLKLSWPTLEGVTFELQQSASRQFRPVDHHWVIGSPSNHSFSHSGLSDGVYFFRIRVANEAWSNIVEVNVEHHSITRAWGFFLVGLLLFVVLMAIVFISGSRLGAGDHSANG